MPSGDESTGLLHRPAGRRDPKFSEADAPAADDGRSPWWRWSPPPRRQPSAQHPRSCGATGRNAAAQRREKRADF
jgi:hypothetical protein